MLTLDARRVGQVTGTEILGIDLRKPIDEELAQALRSELWSSGFLLFRGQQLTPEDQLRIGSVFGEVNQQGATKRKDIIHYVSNARPDGRLGEREILFHSDQCFWERPQRAIMLYGVEVPATGGETLFLNAARAYETLPPELKARVQDAKALHVFFYTEDRLRDKRFRAGELKTEIPDDSPRAVHPVVMPHPATGKPLLYVNENMTDSIVGLSPDESEALLQQLFAHLRAEPVYRHKWSAGDLIVWDNIGVQHARTALDPKQRRTLARSQMY